MDRVLHPRRSSWGLREKFLPKFSRSRDYDNPPPVPSLPSVTSIPSIAELPVRPSTRLHKPVRHPAESYVVQETKAKPGDTPAARRKGQKITPKEIRELRELIRYRYALDVEIWSLRDVKVWDRVAVKDKQRKSMAALRKIHDTVNTWDRREYFESDREYQKMQEVRIRVLEGGKRDWNREPAWMEAENMQ